MIFLTNAFNINMLSGDSLLRFEEMSEDQLKAHLRTGDVESAIGHPATATILSQRLGWQVETNRINVSMEPGIFLYVAQVTMPQLAEGQVLSEQEMVTVPIKYWLVSQEQ